MVLCRIYRKAGTRKSMEERAKPNDVEKEDPVFLAGNEYEEKLSNSFSLNGSCELSNAVGETGVSSLHYRNQEGVCSSVPSKTNDEDNLFECLEPIMFCEENKDCKPPNLELPTFSMDCLLSHEAIPSLWADNINTWTPYALLSTP